MVALFPLNGATKRRKATFALTCQSKIANNSFTVRVLGQVYIGQKQQTDGNL
jgi:hypothetical protein